LSTRGASDRIRVVGASEHNLQNVSLDLPRNALAVFTGVSGSGKSSLAFDTLFKEGQRRFLESLSAYARQFLGQMEKPRVEHVEGLSPTISIDQKTVNRNPRSTVGTITELYDHFRLLFARFGQPYCPNCDIPISTLTSEQVTDALLVRFGQGHGAGIDTEGIATAGIDTEGIDTEGIDTAGASPGEDEVQGAQCTVLAPMVRERKGEYRKELGDWQQQGYLRARIDGELRRLDEEIALGRYEKHTIELVLDRLRIAPETRSRLAEAVERAMELAGGLVNVLVDDTVHQFSGNMACATCGLAIPELEPRLFSFNDPQGACETCNGLGTLHRFTEARLTDPARSLADGALRCFTERGNLPFTDFDLGDILTVARSLGIDTARPWGTLPAGQRSLLLEGNADIRLRIRNVFREPQQLIDGARKDGQWPGLNGILGFIAKFLGNALERFQESSPCPDCKGLRLNPVARAVRFRDFTIDRLAGLTVEDAVDFFGTLALNPTETLIGKDIFREIRGRLGFLRDVGVGYLSLDRRANTLSGGEAQRIRLAAQVGSGLQGVLYVLDEPSIGLHQSDNRKLIQTLHRLRDVGNTVYVVEHDQETIESADHVIDLGPGAGDQGGRILAQGTLQDLLAAPDSLSGQYLAGTRRIEIPPQRRSAGKTRLRVTGARKHNLQGLTVDIPLGVLTVVTGVSGSGKSTLVHDVLKPALSAQFNRQTPPEGLFRRLAGLQHLDKVIEIDQSPIGRTPRSNPATYTKVLDQIRGLFAQTPEARIRGYKPGRFSFNVRGGRCETCEGAGVQTIEMQFLSSVEIVCEECGGRRFNEETLQIHYKGKTIHDVLEMSVDEAAGFFANVPAAARILNTLQDVGLGYVRMGQPSTTLSGGEAQRVKLASELRKRATGRTLYLLDEPTTGLHFEDIRTLLACLDTLVEQGNTVLVIEHNLDVIKVADHVIDLGPGGGQHGGKLVAQGTPEAVAQVADSLTGRELARVLDPAPLMVRDVAPGRNGNGTHDLIVRGAEQNNLQHINARIPHNSLTVITGVSGSGKTSLAFDTIFAEGQARYVESLSTYARRFLGRLDKARVDGIEGLAPAIAIDQKNSGRSPRSTVATTTEIYDYLRLLYARIGEPHCPHCGEALRGHTPTRLARLLGETRPGERMLILAPLFRPASARPTMLDTAAHLADMAPTLQAEGFTRVLLDGELTELADWLALPAGKRKLSPKTVIDLVVDRVRIDPAERKRVAEATEVAFEKGHGLARLVFPDGPAADTGQGGNGSTPAQNATAYLRGDDVLVSEPVGCVGCGYFLDEPFTPRMFSFNSHVGACETCSGLGKAQQVDPALLIPFPERPLLDGALIPGKVGRALARRNWKAERAISAFAQREGINLGRPFADLDAEARQLLLYGDGKGLSFTKRRMYGGGRRTMHMTFRGVTGILLDWYKDPELADFAQHIEAVMADIACPDCQGERLKPGYRAVRIAGRNISQFCAFTVEEALAETAVWQLSDNDRRVAEQPLQEIRARLGFLKDVGLGYLNLRRDAVTLSGGEAQRIRLASQLGSHLVGVLYVLDEPTIGLHPRDTRRLLDTLCQLRDRGNTVVVVEHDPETIAEADHIIDIGPGAGHLGGRIVAQGPPAAVARDPASLTGQYLSGARSIPMPEARRRWKKSRRLQVLGATANNLRNIDVDFPLGTFTAVTGVSGSGKSTLVVGILQQALQRQLHQARVVPGPHRALKGLAQVDKLVVIDQAAIGKSPKSNPATYSGAMDAIRSLLAAMPEAKTRGYKPGRFSFNVKGGRCEACEGRGMNHIEMHFLADVWVPCDLCGGARYNRETLQVRFRGKNIADMLDMEIADALALFANQARIRRPLQSLVDVGLGYMKLGQAANTLSGGEAQRIKLAAELAKPATGGTVYILDEPTTGLHLEDIGKLLTVLHRLADEGNTVIVIEHNLDVIKTADHVIDLGPEGGDAGGQVVAVGSPAELTQIDASHTGRALRPFFAAEQSA